MEENNKCSGKISVIIPVYNAAGTIEQLLDSIMGQTYTDFEIICVDDGSSDSSFEIISKYNNVILEKINNSGPGAARNKGISLAKGEYIMFCDSDDILLEDALKEMYISAKSRMADVVVGRYMEIDSEGNEVRHNINFTNGSEMYNFFSQISSCARLYRRKFIVDNRVKFPDERQGEDRLFLSRLYSCRPRVAFLPLDVYGYIRRDGEEGISLVNDHSRQSFKDRIKCWDEFYRLCHEIDSECASNLLTEGLCFLSGNWKKLDTIRDVESTFYLLQDFFKNKDFDKYVFENFFHVSYYDFISFKEFQEYAAKVVENLAYNNGIDNDRIEPYPVDDSPCISVVIPFYNPGTYFFKCLLTVLAQDLKSFQVIMVNDLSTDYSKFIAGLFCVYDERFSCIDGDGKGAGAARNKALKAAAGKYYCFLDADDYFERNMLSLAYQEAERKNLDICIWNGVELNDVTKKINHNSTMLRSEMIPEEEVFSGMDCKFLFNMTTGAPWNKLFNGNFFRQCNVSFMEQTCFNDVFLVFILLANAKRIGVINQELIVYRVNNKSSLQGAKDKSIKDAFNAFEEIYNRLQSDNLYNEYIRTSYYNYVLSCSMFILSSAKNSDTFLETYSFINETILLKGDVEIYPYVEDKYKDFINVINMPVNEYLFLKKVKTIKETERIYVDKIVEKRPADYDYLKSCEYSLNEIRNSKSYKIGHVFTFLPRLLRHIVKGCPM